MEPPSPVRLYATVAGAGLVLWGIVGFFFDASFASPSDVHDALGLLSVNGWANTFHILTGAVGLLLAGFASRPYAICVSAVYVAVALFGTLM
jgi:Ni,Fe-hydrogenase I cytochrome b subunit